MRIIYVTQLFFPENVAGAFRAYQNSCIWTSCGEEVTVFTAYPNFPTGRIFDGYKAKMFHVERINGVRVFRNKIVARPNTTILNRLIAYLSFVFFSLLNVFTNRREIGQHDVVLGTIGPVFTGLVAYVLSRVLRKPLVIELRDLTFEQMRAVGKGNALSMRAIRALELYLCRKAVRVVTVTRGFRDVLIGNGIEKDKISVIPNGVLLEEYVHHPEEIKLPTTSTLRLVYLGTIGESQDLDRVIHILDKSFEILKLDYQFTIIGDGAHKHRMEDLIKRRGLEGKVRLMGSMPKADLEEYYHKSDLCVVSLKNDAAFQHTVPSKIFDIMAHRKPVLYFGPNGEAASIISSASAGVCITAASKQVCVKDMVDFLESLSADDEQSTLRVMGDNGFNLVSSKYNRHMLAREFLDLLRRACASSG
jgi:glycosyltransferase involved in cell wall biosynthesis